MSDPNRWRSSSPHFLTTQQSSGMHGGRGRGCLRIVLAPAPRTRAREPRTGVPRTLTPFGAAPGWNGEPPCPARPVGPKIRAPSTLRSDRRRSPHSGHSRHRKHSSRTGGSNTPRGSPRAQRRTRRAKPSAHGSSWSNSRLAVPEEGKARSPVPFAHACHRPEAWSTDSERGGPGRKGEPGRAPSRRLANGSPSQE